MKRSERGFIKYILATGVIALGIYVVVTILGGARSSNIALPKTSPFIGGGQTNPLLSFLGNTGTSGGNKSDGNTPKSIYAGSLSVSLGNGAYENQPYKEYVTIRNSGSKSINITGMKLRNSKGERPIETSNNSYVYPSSETGTIPRGAKFLAPQGGQSVGDIILEPGQTAYVVTTNPTPYTSPITVSFRENKCTGYLSSKYSFEPRLSKTCPALADDPDAQNITRECYDYVRSTWQCVNPEDTDKKNFESKTTMCQKFISSHANYPSCVLNHGSDTNFYGDNWYVFLGLSKELWSSDDTVTLLDGAGNVVAKSNW